MPPTSEWSSELDLAVEELARGRQIGLPTETVYGLAADATNPDAVAGIFRIKGRPTGHPLILHLGDVGWLEIFCRDLPPIAYRLAAAFWPGALTMVLFRSEQVPDAVTGGLETVAVRVPSHPVALEILRRFGRPLAAPSANRFGAVSPTKKAHVVADLGDAVSVVVDGGDCEIGVESTILDLTRGTPRLLRPGGVSKERIEHILGFSLREDDGTGPAAPGTLASHYCPRARVQIVDPDCLFSEARRLVADKVRVGLITSATLPADLPIAIVRTGANVQDLAHELYSAFRNLDDKGCEVVLLTLPSKDGIGAAVVDRIQRAAQGASGPLV